MTAALVVFGGYAPGLAGADHMAWNTAVRLSRHGHTVAVVCERWHPRHRAGELPVLAATEAGPVGEGLPWRPDIVHAFDLARPGGVRHAMDIAAAHGVPLALTPASAVATWPDSALGRAACERADVVFALTRWEAAELQACGADPTRIRPLAQAPQLHGTPDPGAFRDRHRIDGPLVLFLGRRVRSKGYAALLAAAPAVREALPGSTVAFAGPGGDEDAVALFAAHRGPAVLDLGMLDEQAKLDALAAADLLCLPTSADVFPLVFVEAWALGTPIVSGDFPGVGDVVRHGVDGFVTATEPAVLAAALVGLLEDGPRRAAMADAGQRRAADLTWLVVADQVAAGYRAALTWAPARTDAP